MADPIDTNFEAALESQMEGIFTPLEVAAPEVAAARAAAAPTIPTVQTPAAPNAAFEPVLKELSPIVGLASLQGRTFSPEEFMTTLQGLPAYQSLTPELQAEALAYEPIAKQMAPPTTVTSSVATAVAPTALKDQTLGLPADKVLQIKSLTDMFGAQVRGDKGITDPAAYVDAVVGKMGGSLSTPAETQLARNFAQDHVKREALDPVSAVADLQKYSSAASIKGHLQSVYGVPADKFAASNPAFADQLTSTATAAAEAAQRVSSFDKSATEQRTELARIEKQVADMANMWTTADRTIDPAQSTPFKNVYMSGREEINWTGVTGAAALGLSLAQTLILNPMEAAKQREFSLDLYSRQYEDNLRMMVLQNRLQLRSGLKLQDNAAENAEKTKAGGPAPKAPPAVRL